MLAPLKLNAIEQEHLQELYNAAGIARDELPYTEKFDELVQGFQDRTFKNAEREQVYGAIVKYVRSAGNPAGELPETKVNDDQIKQLKTLLPRHSKGGKILPYSEEFEASRKEFAKLSGLELTEAEFWHAILRAQGPKRRPPKRPTKVVAAADEEAEEDGE
jgi:hypothetical protein